MIYQLPKQVFIFCLLIVAIVATSGQFHNMNTDNDALTKTINKTINPTTKRNLLNPRKLVTTCSWNDATAGSFSKDVDCEQNSEITVSGHLVLSGKSTKRF